MTSGRHVTLGWHSINHKHFTLIFVLELIDVNCDALCRLDLAVSLLGHYAGLTVRVFYYSVTLGVVMLHHSVRLNVVVLCNQISPPRAQSISSFNRLDHCFLSSFNCRLRVLISRTCQQRNHASFGHSLLQSGILDHKFWKLWRIDRHFFVTFVSIALVIFLNNWLLNAFNNVFHSFIEKR